MSDKKSAIVFWTCIACIPLVLLFTFEKQGKTEALQSVTVSDFSEFVEATGYKTDAEYRDSGFVMHTWNYGEWVQGACWRKPDGKTDAIQGNPVTQVSWNDAVSYCLWKGCTIPSEAEYWEKVQNDNRQMCIDTIALRDANISNVAGNAWDWTSTRVGIHAKAVGGSFLCSESTCKGYDFQYRVFSTDTPNNHIGFSITFK